MDAREAEAASRRRVERACVPEASIEVRSRGWFGFPGRRTAARRLVDVSERGMGVVLEEPVRPDAELVVRAHIPHFGETIVGRVTVRWCRVSPQRRGEYRAGLEFASMPAGQEERIRLLCGAIRSDEFERRWASLKGSRR